MLEPEILSTKVLTDFLGILGAYFSAKRQIINYFNSMTCYLFFYVLAESFLEIDISKSFLDGLVLENFQQRDSNRE